MFIKVLSGMFHHKASTLEKFKASINAQSRRLLEEQTANMKASLMTENGIIDQDLLRELFQDVILNQPENISNAAMEIMEKKGSPEEQIEELCKLTISAVEPPSLTNMKRCYNYFNKNGGSRAFEQFLQNPQHYIDHSPNLSAYQAHRLQKLANDPEFKKLRCTEHYQASLKKYVYTPLINQMYNLHLEKYASQDATRFKQCIREDKKEEVLAKSKKLPSGGPVMGLGGALQSYNRKSITRTAQVVERMKAGACHTFAQLALDKILTAMENGEMQAATVKMATHKAGLNSHTYLIIDHNSDKLAKLTNTSRAIIVDPWAVAMGHDHTRGIFNVEDYPYKGMIEDLNCVYDSRQDTTHQNRMQSNSRPGITKT